MTLQGMLGSAEMATGFMDKRRFGTGLLCSKSTSTYVGDTIKQKHQFLTALLASSSLPFRMLSPAQREEWCSGGRFPFGSWGREPKCVVRLCSLPQSPPSLPRPEEIQELCQKLEPLCCIPLGMDPTS